MTVAIDRSRSYRLEFGALRFVSGEWAGLLPDSERERADGTGALVMPFFRHPRHLGQNSPAAEFGWRAEGEHASKEHAGACRGCTALGKVKA
jgi:hypothetical protein